MPQIYSYEELNQSIPFISEAVNDFLGDIKPCVSQDQETPCALMGKALYPNYFLANERLVDRRQGTMPDSSYQRIEFYFVGTDDIWASMPTEDMKIELPNQSEVILIGTYQPEKMKNRIERMYGIYFKVPR